jgi:hypothetical protein
MEHIRACIDLDLPPDLIVAAARFAVRENPDNAPIEPSQREMMPGVMFSEIQVAALTGKLWRPGRTLRVRFLDGDPRIQKRCIPFAKVWEQYANLKVDFGEDPNAEIRISFKYRGSWSYVGADALAVEKSEPTMNFGWLTLDTPLDEYARVVAHEFGHALGFIHEHQNPTSNIPWNKEAVYAYYQGAPNYWTHEQVDINLFTRYSADITRFSEFDPLSIMLYPIPAEFVLDPAAAVGWNKVPSETDQRYARILYPRLVRPTPELAVDGSRYAATIGEAGEEDQYIFTVVSTGTYCIETFGKLDTVVSLYGPDSDTRMVAKDDDSGRSLNSRIATSLTPGGYLIRLRHFSNRSTGPYEISVTPDVKLQTPLRLG